MPSNADRAYSGNLIDFYQAFIGLYFDSEDMFPIRAVPVLPELPLLGFPRMSLPEHAPEFFKDIRINATKGFR